MDSKLSEIFSNINDWLKFAETKNATLLAGNGVLIFGIIRLIKEGDYSFILVLYVFFVISQLLISFVFCLVSFIPSLEMPWIFKSNTKNDNGNLLYFDDISKYTPISYINDLKKALNIDKEDFTSYEKMLVEQIIVNSVIASKKYKLFKISIWFTLSAIVSPIGAFFLYKLK